MIRLNEFQKHHLVDEISELDIKKTFLPTLPCDERRHTLDPIVTGTSVLGIKYNDGVMLASDTLGSYGSLARFMNIERLKTVGEYTIIGASGEISDFQYIMHMLHELIDEDFVIDDDSVRTPKEIFQYLSRVLYGRRNKFDPLYNAIVVGGYKDDKGFLGYIDLVGTHFEDDVIATGYGAYLAIPLLRKHYESKKGNITEQEARAILEESMRVLYYRDCKTINRMQLAIANKDGVKISEPYSLDTKWVMISSFSL
jgi:20S proteasome subunit beta 7